MRERRETPAPVQLAQMTVATTDTGQRLDLYIARQHPELSRTQARRLIDEGQVTVDGRREKPSYLTQPGARIECSIPEPVPAGPEPEPLILPILYEDRDIVVVDKPAGMVVHPASGHARGTLVNALLHHVHDLSGVGGAMRPGIVHRLDRGTSGVMVVAKHDAAHRGLAAQFHDRQVTKTYVALVWGPLTAGTTMTSPIGRDSRQRLKVSSRSRRAREAVTTIIEAEPMGEVTFVRVRIGTGRTHQIRVHLSEAGHPVVGDALYGGVRRRGTPTAGLSLRLGRPFLHAERLGFIHPATKEAVSFTAPLPPDLESILRSVRSGAVSAPRDHR